MLAACQDAELAVVPFGGGTSVVGGVEPLRDGFAGAVSLDLTRMDRILEVDRESLTASVDPGRLRPDARGPPPGTRPHPRPLSAVVRVLDRRRLGGHALGRPGLDGLRPDRRAGGGRPLHRSQRGRHGARAARVRGRPGAARAAGGLGGRARGALRRHAPGQAAAFGTALRGLVVPLVRGGLRDVPAAGAGGRRPGRGAAVRRGGDAAHDDALLERQRVRARGARLPAPARPPGRLHRDRRIRGHAGDGRAPAAGGRGSAALGGWAGPRGPARPRLASQSLRDALPARRAARSRGDDRDARDGRHLERPAGRSTRRSAALCAPRCRLAAPRRS